MNYTLITCTDGAFLIRSEHTSRDSAVMAYDELHRALIADTSMMKGTIAILDEQLNVLENRWKDTIVHEQEQAEEPTAKRSTKSTK